MNLLQLKNVQKSFGLEVVLKDINLSISKGESFVLVGPSGQGKSVLLKIMAGLLMPDQGEVLFENRNFQTLSKKDKVSLMRSIGMLFQKNALFDSLSASENIAFPLRETTNLSEQQISDRVAFFLEQVGLTHAKNLYPDEISGGMQKRLGIARALALEPAIVFYDDPTAGLDPITSRKIIHLIYQLKQKLGSTIITITNDMNRAYQIADRIAMVINHQVLVTGSVEETKQSQNPFVHQFIRGALEGPLMVSP